MYSACARCCFVSRLISSKAFLILFTLLSACSPSIYYIACRDSLNEISKQPYARKVILIPDNTPQCDKIAHLLNKKRWSSFEKEQKYIRNQTTNQFLLSVRYLLEKKYALCHEALNRIPDTSFDCQALVVKIDCYNALKIDSVDYNSLYQQALDCSNDPIIKEIIKNRYRFYKYGY